MLKKYYMVFDGTPVKSDQSFLRVGFGSGEFVSEGSSDPPDNIILWIVGLLGLLVLLVIACCVFRKGRMGK